jgi:hypothetical protein
MNTRNKMYRTNKKIKKYLLENGFHSIYLFPHLKYIKDYIFEKQGFDALGWKKGDKHAYLFQFKTNKKAPKKVLKEYAKINKKYYVKCLWVNKKDRKGVEIYE